METIFPEHVVHLADLKLNPNLVVQRMADEHRPVLVTRGGGGVAVVHPLIEDETAGQERAFMCAAIAGLTDLESGRKVTLTSTKARLGLE